LCSGLSTPWRDFLLRIQHAGFVSQALSLEGQCVEAEGFALPSAARRIGWRWRTGLHGSEAGGRGGLGAMRHREHLAQVDRFIAECKNRIARQREIIATAYENGHPTDIPVSMLRALEENLRSFEKHRHLILDQLKNARHSRAPAAAS
jgi:hypothetical protein